MLQKRFHCAQIDHPIAPGGIRLVKRHVIRLPVSNDLLWDCTRTGQSIAKFGAQNQIGGSAGGPTVSSREWVNPVQPPHDIGREMECAVIPVRVYVLAHLLYVLRHLVRRGRLMGRAVDVYRPCSVVPSTRIDVLYSQALQPLNRAGPQLEAALGLINKLQNLIKLKEAISGLQSSFLILIRKELVGCRFTIALDVRSSHVRVPALPPRGQLFRE